jgi:hypothetical protein
MADDVNKSSSWWSTLPGVLTATAAVLTAIGSLTAVLYQNGVLGSKAATVLLASDKKDGAGASTPAHNAPTANNSGTSSAPARVSDKKPTDASPVPWDKALVTVTSGNGQQTKLRAATLSFNGGYLALEGGQQIALTNLRSFEVLSVASNGSVDMQIETLNGTRVSGLIADMSLLIADFRGDSELGPFGARLRDIKRVDFGR